MSVYVCVCVCGPLPVALHSTPRLSLLWEVPLTTATYPPTHDLDLSVMRGKD